MAVIIERRYSEAIYPLHALLLAGTLPLFIGAALCDAAYASTYQIQWNNFASWLIAGGLVFAGVALIFAIVDLCRARRRARGIVLYAALLLATWVLGFLNALMHARDAWASMPAGLVLSVIVALLTCAATWFGFCTPRIGGAK
ncbi:DUF2231 domain-containing protein [Pollutimonas sp. M17]|uniref:DUF2231 domain-containing protein n=1 Tax=Pollutimonas sp. M17 TaxID=2962065 RepID=UPI0021F4621A|nr:DUF2231 domain-containing protein [Pollutimonas sp. M17]UYO94661.1 hypothetical protein OEG81_04875 [Pollutimonas sp. M17]